MSKEEIKAVYLAQAGTFALCNLLTALNVIRWDEWTGYQCMMHAENMLDKGILKCQKFDL